MSWFQMPPVLLPDLIERHGKWRAARTALVEGDQRLTWREFEQQTAQVANGLAAAGLERGDHVAVLMGNSVQLAVLLFGIVRSGCVAVPLNVGISDAAVAGMIEDSAARAVFASGTHCARIDTLGASSAAVNSALKIGHEAPAGWTDFDTWRAAQATRAPQIAIAPDDGCNIIYSSGTTGVPKGIAHTHGCRLNWAADMASVLRYRSDCVTLCSLGLFSNISWVSMLPTVLVGGTIVLMKAFDARAALELIERERVTHGSFVPLQLEQFLAAPDLERRDLHSLDTLMVCGSPVRLAVKQAFPRRMGCRLIELYGLTEGLCTILAPEDFELHTASVGKPFLGTDLRIVGEDDCEVAPGTTGEIVGRGPLLMAGYHGREAASREATWLDERGERWLRTGDLGFVDAEGFLFVVDRKKDMILSGGQNIYPADIEQVMRDHPDVAQVAVIGARSRKWGETPVAVVVPREGGAFDREGVIAWTNARVGKQQRIADLVCRASLPRNANGKILKRELRDEFDTREY